jgi:hypothetical protein
MYILKTLAVSAMAILSPLGGHVGPGLAAATAAVAEDWKDGGLAETTFDAVVADGPRAGKWKALGGSLKKLAGALGSTKLRGSNFNSDAAVVATSDETAGGVDESHLEKRERISSKAAAAALQKIRDDFDKKGLTESHAEKLPSEDYLKEITGNMYDSIKAANATNATTAPSTSDALMFMTDRLEGDTHTSAYQDAELCFDMFAEVLLPSMGHDSVHSPESLRNLTALNMTHEELKSVATLCSQEPFSARLEELGYDPDHFCPPFEQLLPIRVPMLPVEMQTNLTYLCGYLADDLFITAGEPECYHRLEEIIIRNAIANGKETPFPGATTTPTFNETFLDVCYSHRSIDNPNRNFCENALLTVHDLSNDFDRDVTTNVEFMSHMCDAIGFHLPHPNTTIALRYASRHVHHKPGGKHTKIRHMIADLFHYAGHFKHGFMDRNGQYISHPTDFLLDPEVEESAQTSDYVNKEQKNTWCTGLAFSVGGGISVEAGPMSVGGGVDWGFGNSNREREAYEESWVWGVCMDEDSINIAEQKDKAQAPETKDAKKNSKSGGSVSGGVEATVGFWRSVGDIPGSSKSYELSFQYLIVSGSIAVVTITSYDPAGKRAGWQYHQSFGGLMFSVGLSSPDKSIDFETSFCFGDYIEKKQFSVPDLTSCGKITYSMDFTPVDNDSTYSGLTAYYYKTKSDWDSKSRILINTWCSNPSQSGYQNHFDSYQVYGVGLQAYGNDAYKVGTLKVTQRMNFFDWIDILVMDSEDERETWSVSRDKYDSGGSYWHWEWNFDRKTRKFDDITSKDWRYSGFWQTKVTVDTWLGAGNNRELTDNDIIFKANGNHVETLHGTWHINHSTSGKIDVNGGGFNHMKLLEKFEIWTTSSHGFRHKNDMFTVDYVQATYKDRHGKICKGLNDVAGSDGVNTFGGNNSKGWCLIWSSTGGSCWDVPKKHCFSGKAGDAFYFNAITGNHGFGSTYRTDSHFCTPKIVSIIPGKRRFREVWPECSNEEDYLKIDSVAIDYDQENGLIPRSQVVDAIVNEEVQQISVDIYGNGQMHTVLLSNVQVTHMENVEDPELILPFSLSGAVLVEFPDFVFTVICDDAEEQMDCRVVRQLEYNVTQSSSTTLPTSSEELVDSCNAVADDISMECLDLEYTVALYAIASPHFSLVATMNNQDKVGNMECPRIISFNSLDGKKKRHVVQESLAEGLHHHVFGAAKLGDILKAEEQVDAIKDSEFDVESNNCVTFAANIWRRLGFKETVQLAEFLTENIVDDEGTPSFLNAMRSAKSATGRRALAALALGKDSMNKYVSNVVSSQLFIEE